ncbi:DUF4189 domain-containing protein [Nocardia sp. NPDC055321]
MSLLKKITVTTVAAAAAPLLSAAPAQAAQDLYGAIAAGGFTVGTSIDYPTQHEADQAAIDSCGLASGARCNVQVRIHNNCGVVLERDSWSIVAVHPSYTSGTGATIAEAEENARKLAGPGLNQPPLFYTVKPLFVLDAICTSNAG